MDNFSKYKKYKKKYKLLFNKYGGMEATHEEKENENPKILCAIGDKGKCKRSNHEDGNCHYHKPTNRCRKNTTSKIGKSSSKMGKTTGKDEIFVTITNISDGSSCQISLLEGDTVEVVNSKTLQELGYGGEYFLKKGEVEDMFLGELEEKPLESGENVYDILKDMENPELLLLKQGKIEFYITHDCCIQDHIPWRRTTADASNPPIAIAFYDIIPKIHLSRELAEQYKQNIEEGVVDISDGVKERGVCAILPEDQKRKTAFIMGPLFWNSWDDNIEISEVLKDEIDQYYSDIPIVDELDISSGKWISQKGYRPMINPELKDLPFTLIRDFYATPFREEDQYSQYRHNEILNKVQRLSPLEIAFNENGEIRDDYKQFIIELLDYLI